MPKTRPADVPAPAPAERLAVAVSVAGTRTRISTGRVQRLARHVLRAEKIRDAMVSIAFVSPRTIATLNDEYLGHTGPTDVISFGFDSHGKGAALGDIYICPAVARDNARAFGGSTRDELDRLVVHGVLHVLGWEHPEDARRESSKMWKRQEHILKAWHRNGGAT
jgi:probable rRNA maturation factor